VQTFLDRLDREARDLLMAVARPITHAKGERLIRYGDASRGAYLLKDGSCEATVLMPGGEKLTVAKLDAGGVFGEMALVERGTCTATVTATTKLNGWFIERDDFRSLVAQRIPAALRPYLGGLEELARTGIDRERVSAAVTYGLQHIGA